MSSSSTATQNVISTSVWASDTKTTDAQTLQTVNLNTDLQPGQALLKHLASIVCFTDVSTSNGTYFRSFPTPITPGYAFVAVVQDIAKKGNNPLPDGCPDLAVGDVVCAMLSVGGWKTHSIVDITAPKKNLVKVPFPLTYNSPEDPHAVDLTQLVALVLNSTTAYQMIRRTGISLKDGDHVLVHAAAGGVGSALCELLRLEHPNVVVHGTCSTEKVGYVESMGVRAIDYKRGDFVAALEREKLKMKAVFDGVGPSQFGRDLRLLDKDGKLVMFGLTDGGSFLSVLGVLARNLNPFSSVSSTFFGVILEREAKPAQYSEDLTKLIHLLKDKKYTPHVEMIVPFDQALNALKIVRSGKTRGSVVALIDPDVIEFYKGKPNFKESL
ncbi:hypothetical protein DFJ73DRAFT_810810 [Zopfochytrium polystomum]|nr:hypothetical protein DFJ73DRAFT_810810 [Zopfochytrium polystomum]